MQSTASVTDLNRYRQRRQALRNAELMWAMYAVRAGMAQWAAAETLAGGDSHSARS